MALVPLSWSSAFRVVLLLVLLGAIAAAFISLPVEKVSLSSYILSFAIAIVKHDLSGRMFLTLYQGSIGVIRFKSWQFRPPSVNHVPA